jgi:aquaporin Z
VISALRTHWPEYLIEAAGLGAFMMSACAFGVLIFHPESRVFAALGSDLARRAVMGVAMGATSIAIIYSPWGRRSGAHINPSTTLAFLRLGKIARADAAFYVAAQFIGGIAGVAASWALLGDRLAHRSIRFVATLPGPEARSSRSAPRSRSRSFSCLRSSPCRARASSASPAPARARSSRSTSRSRARSRA